MPKVVLRKDVGKHRLNDGSLVEPGQEIELSGAALANIGDKFEKVHSADELMDMAEKKAEEEAKAAEAAKERADASAKKAAEIKKAGSQGKG